MAITAPTVIELYRTTWQGPVALVVHFDAEHRRISRRWDNLKLRMSGRSPLPTAVASFVDRYD
jgi:hypothetical protein